MKKKLSAVVLVLCFWAIPAFAQYANKDIAVYYLLTPTTSPKLDQSVQFYPVNQGTSPIEQFEARVYKNGQLLFTEQVHETIKPNDWESDPVRLQGTVHMEYEETADVTLKLILDGDEDTSNNTTTMHFTMPRTMDYPFTWTDDNCRVNFHDGGFANLDWQFDDYWGAYYMNDRSTNWMGTLSSDVMLFPENEAVKCSFEFATSGGDVTLYFTKDYGDNDFETDTVMVGHSTDDFTATYYTFRAKGPAIVHITASLGGDWMASGSIFLRNICFSQAQKDLVAKQILQPVGNASALGCGETTVAARFHNPSSDDIVNPSFCYDAGIGIITETYQGSVASGEYLDYVFTKGYQYSGAGEGVLKVWCEVEGDSDSSNDLLEKTITYYEPLSFPYTTLFDEEDNILWTAIDVNGDGQTFDFIPMANNNMAATFFNYAADEVNDKLLSPVMRIPAGKHRVDFNYACYNEKNDVNLKLYLDNLQGEQQLLFDRNLDSQLWQTGYHLLDIPTEGLYQFVFEAKGSKDAVVIDNFKVDDGEDLGIINVSFGTASGFNLQPTTVTINYANFGISPQRDVMLGYSINNGEMVEELNPVEVMPGDTVSYTFNTLADISQVDTVYDLMGMILTNGGDEDINDIAYAPLLYNNRPQQIPYFNDFGYEERMQQWQMQSNLDPMFSGWEHTYASSSYSPLGVLKHSNWDEQTADSWAFSEGIEIHKGVYEVSYFHHESEWFQGDDYEQSFELKMGMQPTAEGMTIDVDRQEHVDVCYDPYEKIIRVVEIPEDGIYYLGFHNISEPGYGYTDIDDVRIEAINSGAALPYMSDFAGEDAHNWTLFDPNDWYYIQWQNEDGVLKVERTFDDQWINPEGMAVSPKLHLEANSKVNITLHYAVDSADRSLTLNLFAGHENNEATMTLLQELPNDQSEYTLQIETGSEAQDMFFGFRTNTVLDGSVDYSYGPFYTVTVSSLEVKYDKATGIEDIDDESLTDSPLYNPLGQRVHHVHGLVIKRGKKMLAR